MNKQQALAKKQLLDTCQETEQLLKQERHHLYNLRDKKFLEIRQEGVALLAERAELRAQVKAAQERTLQEEQRGFQTPDEIKKSVIVARAAKLAEHEMAKKMTYEFTKQARDTLAKIDGEFALKASEDAELKKELSNDPIFFGAKQKFNRHIALFEQRKTFEVLKTRPNLAALPEVQGALQDVDAQGSGAALLGEMSQLQDQIQDMAEMWKKAKRPHELVEDNLESQMEAVSAEIDAIDPSKFLKNLPEVRTTTPSSETCSNSRSSSSWSSSRRSFSTGSYQSSMLRA